MWHFWRWLYMASGLMSQIPLSSSPSSSAWGKKEQTQTSLRIPGTNYNSQGLAKTGPAFGKSQFNGPPTCCSQPPVSHSSPDMRLWFDNFAKGRTGRGKKSQKTVSSSSVHHFSFSLSFILSPPDLSFAWHFFIWAAICPLSGLLAFKVL